jgi:Cu-Zn family superoxide dismutase
MLRDRLLFVVFTGAIVALGAAGSAAAKGAAHVSVPIHLIDANGLGADAGTLTLSDSAKGLSIKAALKGLPPGDHGFHLHEKPSCDPGEKDGKTAAGIGAGGHFDPTASGKHLGPEGEGHHGDLPLIHVGADGKASETVVAPHLHLADVHGKAIVIHAGGDNYSDQPEPLGGGGARIACGIVK